MADVVPGGPWYTVAETAALLRMSENWVRDRIRDKSLPAKKITDAGRGRYRINGQGVATLMASRPDAGDTPTPT